MAGVNPALPQLVRHNREFICAAAARSAIIMIASPLGTAAGGPIVATLGAAWTLTASGTATIALAVIVGTLWTRRRRPQPGKTSRTSRTCLRGPGRADQVPGDGQEERIRS